MSYLPAIVVAAVGLLVLVLLIVKTLGHARRFRRVVAEVNAGITYETGTLKARTAGVRVAMKETRARVNRAPADVPSISRGRQEDDRG
jgi:hypothetical protein